MKKKYVKVSDIFTKINTKIIKKGNNYYYPWKKLVPDSYFFISNKIVNSLPSKDLSVRNAACQRTRLYGEKYRVLKSPNGYNVLRVV